MICIHDNESTTCPMCRKLHAQPAAPSAPTAVQQSYCNICGQGVVDGTLACGHVYTGWLDKTPAPQGGKCFGKHGPAPDTRHAEAQEPKAQDDPTWMDDCINVCSRHSLQFTKERDECFICTNRAANAPDVTARVEAAERVLSVCGPEGGELECYCGSVMGDDGELDEKRMCAPCELRTAIAAVKKERS